MDGQDKAAAAQQLAKLEEQIAAMNLNEGLGALVETDEEEEDSDESDSMDDALQLCTPLSISRPWMSTQGFGARPSTSKNVGTPRSRRAVELLKAAVTATGSASCLCKVLYACTVDGSSAGAAASGALM